MEKYKLIEGGCGDPDCFCGGSYLWFKVTDQSGKTIEEINVDALDVLDPKYEDYTILINFLNKYKDRLDEEGQETLRNYFR